MMIRKSQWCFLSLFFFSLFSSVLSAQSLEKGALVDGITAVIGDEIVLESDIDEQMNYAKQQGIPVTDRCTFLANIVNNKLLIYEAKRDTLIENRTAYLKDIADQKYSQILSNFPDEKTMLSMYKYRNAYEMKNAIEKIDTDNYYGQQKYGRITEKVDVTPNEVTDFYAKNQHQLPMVKDEVSISQIVMYPKLTEEHKSELKSRLLRIKQDILAGESFDQMARIYSEDTGSAVNGGLITNISRGQMVKPFEAGALNLQEGEISDPVETEYGYHLIQLVKRSGKQYDARHILLQAEPNAEEIASARAELDSIRTMIMNGEITFKEAAFKYSDDKNTKFNGGTLTGGDGSDKIEKMELPATQAYQIVGIKPGDITEVFQDELNRRKTVNILRVNEEIAAHQMSIETDYERIKELALQQKKGQVVEKWVKEKLQDTFISINSRYDHCSFTSEWNKSK